MMIKISMEDFNDLQTQQAIRDSAQETIRQLRWLNSIVKRKHNKKINEMIDYILDIENESVGNISKMIEWSEK